jgi:hypothetical protein
LTVRLLIVRATKPVSEIAGSHRTIGCAQGTYMRRSMDMVSPPTAYTEVGMQFVRRFLAVAAIAFSGVCAHATPVLYGTFYDETPGLKTCNDATYCRQNFAQLSSTKLTLATSLHCRLSTTSPVVLATLRVSATDGGAALGRYVPLTINRPPGTLSGYYYATVDTDPRFLMGQSRYPFIEVVTDASSSLLFIDCTLSGQLVDPIQ